VDVDVDGASTAVGGRELPDTATAQTGRGWHFLYRTKTPIPPKVGVLEHVDLRGPGSYFVAPPSRHVSGAEYAWITTPGERIADAPAWVSELAETTRVTGAAADEKIPEGKRNATLTSIGGAMRARGASEAAILAGLLEENRTRCVPPLPADEVAAVANSVSRYEPDGPELHVTHNGKASVTPVGIDAVDLLALDLPPLRMIVPDLLPEGTTILAAPPKVGKSCLVYQIVTEVAIGGELLERRVSPGSCLYLALEDGQRRGQDRLKAALGDRTFPRGRLEVRWAARRIGEGLEDDLRIWLDSHADAAVVAIDTLQRVRPQSNGRRGAYEIDVEDLGSIQTLVRDRPVALVVVHHSRKESGDDFLASVSGTYGLTGSADSIVVIKRKRLEAFGTIVATGRDIAEAEVAAQFDGLLWHAAPMVLSQPTFERAEVYDVIERQGPIFPAAIAMATGLGRTSVQNIVQRLVDGGAVARVAKGYIISAIRVASESHSSHPETPESHSSHPATSGQSDSQISPNLLSLLPDCSDSESHLSHSDSEEDAIRQPEGVKSHSSHPAEKEMPANRGNGGSVAGFEQYLEQSRGAMWDRLDRHD
jgi:hypothetical protein